MDIPRLAIIIPCYNESEIISDTLQQLSATLESLKKENLIKDSSRIIAVDDGSKDDTWSLLVNAKDIIRIKLSRNYGHQNALLAGIAYAKDKFDCNITIDADLQDDIACLKSMVLEYIKGSQVVYGVRSSRKKDSFFKKTTAQFFYKLMKFFGVNVVYNHADFRLLSNVVSTALGTYEEQNMFLRGIIPLIGYKSSTVYYERKPRLKGESKYPFKKMLSFALNGITSFTFKPLALILNFAIFGLTLTFLAILYYIIGINILNQPHLLSNDTEVLILIILTVGFLNMLALGLVASYLGKLYNEVKHRPRYFVETIIDNNKEN
jgi:glycosyltransferase involved in cell wall biosynthesis